MVGDLEDVQPLLPYEDDEAGAPVRLVGRLAVGEVGGLTIEPAGGETDHLIVGARHVRFGEDLGIAGQVAGAAIHQDLQGAVIAGKGGRGRVAGGRLPGTCDSGDT